MRPYIHDDFLLSTESSRKLFHTFASSARIIDYHNHLSPADIASDRRWNDLTELWLAGDHYKWRQMRANGADERFCTGDAPAFEKFKSWAAVLPRALRNPLHHWTHLELARFFGVADKLLSPETADEIWSRANEVISSSGFTCRNILRKMNVRALCTTDDPCDTLEHHDSVAKSGFEIMVFPTFRPDKVLAVEDPAAFNAWIDRLSAASGSDVRSFAGLQDALRKRRDAFHDRGCRLADHGLASLSAVAVSERDLAGMFDWLRAGRPLEARDLPRYKLGMMTELGRIYAEKDWTWMIHVGVLRNANSRMFGRLGPDAGYDIVGDGPHTSGLARLFDVLAAESRLPRTLLFNINSSDNDAFSVLCGAFQEGPQPGRVQTGPGWWFLDQKKGMESQIDSLSNMGLLGRFVGMTTDSRSFLSFCRHEYFRRILCDMLGRDLEAGLIPDDETGVGRLVEDICYNNARDWFGLPIG
jgi:glucuronate isomerase